MKEKRQWREQRQQKRERELPNNPIWIRARRRNVDCAVLTRRPLTCGVVIDGAIISSLNICNEILLLLLDLAMGSLSLMQLLSGLYCKATKATRRGARTHARTLHSTPHNRMLYLSHHYRCCCCCCRRHLPPMNGTDNDAFSLRPRFDSRKEGRAKAKRRTRVPQEKGHKCTTAELLRATGRMQQYLRGRGGGKKTKTC